jgi:hypothetical protein
MAPRLGDGPVRRNGRRQVVMLVAIATLAGAMFWPAHQAALAAGTSRLDVRPAGALFTTDGTALYPGGPAWWREIVITYHGPEAATVALYVGNFVARAPSRAGSCAAADPARMLLLDIQEGRSTLFSGTLSGFASVHGDAPDALPLRSPRGPSWLDGDGARIQLRITLDLRADNSYMGCTSGADLDWVAE